MPRELLSIALPVLAIVGGAVWQSSTNARIERNLERMLTLVEAAKSPGSARGACTGSIDPAVIQAEIRAAFRNIEANPSAPFDVTRAAPAGSARDSEAEPEAPAVEKSAEAIQAFDDANLLVDTALARRTWSPDDVLAFRALQVHLDAQSREDITHRIIQAVNAGRLNPTDGRHGLF